MQPLELNLASRPFKNNTLLWVGFGTAVIVLALFTAWNIRSFSRHRTLVADLDREVSTIEEQFSDLETRRIRAQQGIRGYDLDSLAIQADKADDVIRWKAFSWTRLFNRLETIQPWDVRMTSVHPIFRSRRTRFMRNNEEDDGSGLPVSVEGVAKDPAAFRELQMALLADTHFDRVEPTRSARERITDHTIFDMRFSYDPGAKLVDVAQTGARPDDGESEAGPRQPEPEAPVQQQATAAPAEPQVIERPSVEPTAIVRDPVEAEVVAETGFGKLGTAVEPDAAAVTEAADATLSGPEEDGEPEELFPDNPPPQTVTPKARRPTSRNPPAPTRRKKPSRPSRGSMGGG